MVADIPRRRDWTPEERERIARNDGRVEGAFTVIGIAALVLIGIAIGRWLL